MLFEEIKSKVGGFDVFEMIYLKDNEETIWHVSDVEFIYGNKCIRAYCQKIKKELTFKLSNIKTFEIYWHIFSSNVFRAPLDGIYIISHLLPSGQLIDQELDMYILKKDEEITLMPGALSYHYIPFYEVSDKCWKKIEGDLRHELDIIEKETELYRNTSVDKLVILARYNELEHRMVYKCLCEFEFVYDDEFVPEYYTWFFPHIDHHDHLKEVFQQNDEFYPIAKES